MADDFEEKPSISHDFSSTKAAIFETVNKLRKWREEQAQQFLNLQYLESKKITQLSGESQKQFEKLLGNTLKTSEAEERPQNHIPEISNLSCLSLKNDLENYDTLHESSITGHLQRCFNDSSASSTALSENKVTSVADAARDLNEAQNCQFFEKNATENRIQQVKNVKPKRPFLKKGSGLSRYMPKTSSSGQKKNKKDACVSNTPLKRRNIYLPQKTLQLKPAIRKTDRPSENIKHIRFDIPVTSNEDVDYISENNVPKFSKLIENKVDDDTDDKYSSLSSSPPDHSPQRSNKSEVVSNAENERLNQSKENKELEEFEMLENCVQNSSFNSDSSVVQRILHGETTKPFPVTRKEILEPPLSSNMNYAFKETYNPGGISIFSPKVGLSKCLEEAHARKEILQKVISDINPRIQSLQREIYRSTQETLDDSDINERCSTPIEDLNIRDRITPTLPKNCIEGGFSDFYDSPPTVLHGKMVNDDDEVCQTNYRSCVNDDVEDLYLDDSDEEGTVIEESDVVDESKQVSNDRSKIRNKLNELEKEIETYQELNAKLSASYKERNELIKKLQKEQEEFNKYKIAEKKKLEAEIEKERRQIKLQKETFTRLQKLRKDNPTRKEREEMNSLRQEVEKLQEELKRQKIKYTSDSRRWKNQLEVAERDRDNFKLENIRLEEQCQDLLAALKTRMKKRVEAKTNDKVDSDTGHENFIKESPATKDVECQTEIVYFSSDHSKTFKQVSPENIAAKKAKSKVRFNLSPEYQENEFQTVCEDVENRLGNQLTEDLQPTENSVAVDLIENANLEKDTEASLSTISVSAELDFKEIDHGNKKERIYATGEREITFNNGTRKIISVDGKTKILFYNGVIKEIFPDKRAIYRYLNGITETHYPDDIKITEFPSGKIERCYPDGQKEVVYPNGTVHKTFADGSEESRLSDGTIVILSADGTKTIEFVNGQKEIRTSTYKRREFPDGAVKILYDSGRQETRYPNGRIRIKDKEGKVVFDTKYLALTKD